MRDVHLLVHVDESDPDAVFDRVKDFSRYPGLVDVVRSVAVHPVSDHEENSDWEVYFRNGILRWTETDLIDPAARTIAFTQLDGDFAEFSGAWRITAVADGCRVRFDARFDFGIPSLRGILDPVAERVFKETVARIVLGLFGAASVVGEKEPAGAEAPAGAR